MVLTSEDSCAGVCDEVVFFIRLSSVDSKKYWDDQIKYGESEFRSEIEFYKFHIDQLMQSTWSGDHMITI